MTENPKRRFLNIQEACELLRWKPKTIYDKIHHGKLPFPYVKIGKLLFEESDILDFLDSCKVINANAIVSDIGWR